jgi:PEP-CTERM motif
VLSGDITAVLLGGDAVVFANNQSGLDGNVFSNSAPFNGPILTDVTNASAFSGWTVTSATAGYTSAYLTGGAIGVNFSGQLYNGGEVVIGASGVPEPSTWAMLMLGFGSLGFAGYRRGKGAPAFAA